jgi:type IV pilus assembly protein PilM
LVALGKELSGNADRRVLWLELLRAINQALPVDPKTAGGQIPDPKVVPITQRQNIHVEYIESQYFPELKNWFTEQVKTRYILELVRQRGGTVPPAADAATNTVVAPKPATPAGPAAKPAPATPAPAPAGPAPPAATPAVPVAGVPAGPGAAPAAGAPAGQAPVVPAVSGADVAAAAGSAGINPDQITGPSGPGWVIEIQGYHFYNNNVRTQGGTHVRNTFLPKLNDQIVQLPTEPGSPPENFTMKELGIDYVILLSDPPPDRTYRVRNPFFEGTPGSTGYGSGMGEGLSPSGLGMPAGVGAGLGGLAPAASGAAKPKPKEEGPVEPPFYPAPKYTFIVQFCWQEQLLSARLLKRQQAAQPAQELPAQGQPPQAQPPQGQPQPTPADQPVAAAGTGG